MLFDLLRQINPSQDRQFPASAGVQLGAEETARLPPGPLISADRSAPTEAAFRARRKGQMLEWRRRLPRSKCARRPMVETRARLLS